MNRTISPWDIKRPEQFAKSSLTNPCHLYTDTLGKCEYEKIAQRLLEASQKEGKWVSLPLEDFVSAFQFSVNPAEEASCYLDQMIDETAHLRREGQRFALTSTAIRAMFRKYSAKD